MKTKKKIKDIYGCKYIEPTKGLYPLQIWYNQLIDKTIAEIDIMDTLRMIRQKEFLDLAIKKALDYLKVNIFVGDMYEGEMLEMLYGLKNHELLPYENDLKNILSHALEESQNHDWLCDEEKKDFEDIIQNFSKRILRKD